VDTVGERYQRILERVDRAARSTGRDATDVVLVGASKRQPIERLEEAWEAGLRVFGENRVQEALEKQPLMPSDAEWHLIGPLQSNKARPATEAFSTIQSIDRARIARRLDGLAAETGRALDGFLEVNLGAEPSKHGFPPGGLLEAAEPLLDLERLRIVGLMAIPPQESDPERARAWFRELRGLRDRLFERPRWSDRPGFLSMGMSDDFEIAVEEGATHVRIGTALFGPRA
jgi:pyridoxal phosphate enzyme (YggS family)